MLIRMNHSVFFYLIENFSFLNIIIFSPSNLDNGKKNHSISHNRVSMTGLHAL